MMPFPKGQYGVIYADPPWRYEMWSEKGHAKGAEAQYNTMSFAELCAMRDDVLFATAPNAVLFMWTTWAAGGASKIDHLRQSLDLMSHWGFERKTGGAWGKITKTGKQAFGAGYIMRSADEPFIIGTIGNPKIKNHSTRNRIYTGEVPDDLGELGISISSLRRQHSCKPNEMRVLLEELFDGPYLEMFGRTNRAGWDVWGDEVGKFGEDAS